MSTELQKQVSAFKKKTAQVQSLQRGLPSIFLGPKEAAAVDTSAVYEAGCKGLQDLLQYDERFRAFESSLFHSSSVNLQRELKTKEVWLPVMLHDQPPSELVLSHRKMPQLTLKSIQFWAY